MEQNKESRSRLPHIWSVDLPLWFCRKRMAFSTNDAKSIDDLGRKGCGELWPLPWSMHKDQFKRATNLNGKGETIKFIEENRKSLWPWGRPNISLNRAPPNQLPGPGDSLLQKATPDCCGARSQDSGIMTWAKGRWATQAPQKFKFFSMADEVPLFFRLSCLCVCVHVWVCTHMILCICWFLFPKRSPHHLALISWGLPILPVSSAACVAGRL